MRRLVLASASKRRAEMLKNAGYDFDVIIPDVDEEALNGLSPPDMVLGLSRLKALAVLPNTGEGAVVLGSDTVVVYRGEILGKPKDKAHAFSMLENLSGDTHYVCTGVCIHDRQSGEEVVFYEKAAVHMVPVSPSEIEAYIATGQPMDKAGSYGIQGPGGMFISGIEGDFYTVCGLPLSRVYRELKKAGVLPDLKNVDYI